MAKTLLCLSCNPAIEHAASDQQDLSQRPRAKRQGVITHLLLITRLQLPTSLSRRSALKSSLNPPVWCPPTSHPPQLTSTPFIYTTYIHAFPNSQEATSQTCELGPRRSRSCCCRCREALHAVTDSPGRLYRDFQKQQLREPPAHFRPSLSIRYENLWCEPCSQRGLPNSLLDSGSIPASTRFVSFVHCSTSPHCSQLPQDTPPPYPGLRLLSTHTQRPPRHPDAQLYRGTQSGLLQRTRTLAAILGSHIAQTPLSVSTLARSVAVAVAAVPACPPKSPQAGSQRRCILVASHIAWILVAPVAANHKSFINSIGPFVFRYLLSVPFVSVAF